MNRADSGEEEPLNHLSDEALLDSCLDWPERPGDAVLAQHLLACESCRSRLTRLREQDRAVSELLRGLPPAPPMPDALAARLDAALEEARNPGSPQEQEGRPDADVIPLRSARWRAMTLPVAASVALLAGLGLLVGPQLGRLYPATQGQAESSSGGTVGTTAADALAAPPAATALPPAVQQRADDLGSFTASGKDSEGAAAQAEAATTTKRAGTCGAPLAEELDATVMLVEAVPAADGGGILVLLASPDEPRTPGEVWWLPSCTSGTTEALGRG